MSIINKKLLLIALFINVTSGCFCFHRSILIQPNQNDDQIKWDKWGVPHIYARSTEKMYYGFGWAQMESHANKILQLYGQARGRGAEYWGETYYENDLLNRKLGVDQRARLWFDSQDFEMKTNIMAFVKGMNDYCIANLKLIDKSNRVVLPLIETDPLAHLQIAYHLKIGGFATLPQAKEWKNAGSNAWAISPQRSASGHSMLLIQPHPPWNDYSQFFEAHLIGPEYEIYGIALLGIPSIAMGFNQNHGWGLTFNQADAMDLIEVEIQGDSYKLGNEWVPFKKRNETIKIKKSNQIVTVRETVFGPIVEEANGKGLALRLSGLDRPFFLTQFVKMASANNLNSFEEAMKMLQFHFRMYFMPVLPEKYFTYTMGLSLGENTVILDFGSQ